MRIYVTGVFVDDQEKALRFYTEHLGFQKKHDVPVGKHRWLTVVSSEQPEGTELLLEPNEHPAVQSYRDAMNTDGIPAHSFQVDDCQAEFERLKERGIHFTQVPLEMGGATTAVFDDTCGNLIQILSL